MRNLLSLVLLFNSLFAFSQSIFNNPITDTDPSMDNPYTNGQIINSNLSVTGIGRGTGITGVTSSDRYNASGWNSTSFDANDYYEWIITPNSNYSINFVSFVYIAQKSGTGPTSFSFRSSIDGFTNNIGSPTSSGTTISLSGSSFQSIVNAITFRIYGWNASGSGGTFSINDFTFNGTVNSTLPISLTKFNAFFQNKQVNLSWSKGDAKNFDKFVVEHSTNGVDFVAIEEIASRNSDDYATFHTNPAKGNNYYRLKMMDLDGSFRYSDTKTVTVKGTQEWSVYPTKATAMITASVSENEEATVQILNTNGQVMYTANSNGNTLVELPISNLSQGLYLVQIIEKGAVVFTERIIKE